MLNRNNVAIRPARPEDANDIARVHVDSWRTMNRGIVPDSVLDSPNTERWQHWLQVITDASSTEHVFVAETGEHRVIGFVSGGPERSGEYPAFTGEIYTLYLADAWHGHGIGRQLMQAGVRDLLERGRRSMLIWVRTETPACGFYRHLGGVSITKRQRQITISDVTLEEIAFGWKNISLLLESDSAGD